MQKSLPKKSLKTIKIGLTVSTLTLGFLAILPFSTSAQTDISETEFYLSQSLQNVGGYLAPLCTPGIDFPNTTISGPQEYIVNYFNPKTPHSSTSACDGTGLTVRDTRFDGGFELQVAINSDYTNGNGGTILAENLGVLTEQAGVSYTEEIVENYEDPLITGTLLSGSTDDATIGEHTKLAYTLPTGFNFNFYGTEYSGGTDIYICSDGVISLPSIYNPTGVCPIYSTDPEQVLEFVGPLIIPYLKDITTSTTIDPTYGVYALELDTDADPEIDEIVFRWKGSPCVEDDVTPTNCEDDTTDLGVIEYEVHLYDTDDAADKIEYIYGNVTDKLDGPVVGITKGVGSPAVITDPTSNTYSESVLSRQNPPAPGNSSRIANRGTIFNKSGFDFTEIFTYGQPAAFAPLNGDPQNDPFYNFTGPGSTQVLIDAPVYFVCGGSEQYINEQSYKETVTTLSTSGESTTRFAEEGTTLAENDINSYTIPAGTGINFDFYDISIQSGDTIYVCGDGSISFADDDYPTGNCPTSIPVPADQILVDSGHAIYGYAGDITTLTSIDGSYGIFGNTINENRVVIEWRGLECVPDDVTPANCETDPTGLGRINFEIHLVEDDDTDYVEIHYLDMTGQSAGPVIGLTKGTGGEPLTEPTRLTYTESSLSEAPAPLATTLDQKTATFTYNQICSNCPGRLGLYTIYPSYELTIPATENDASYEQNSTTYYLTEGDYSSTVTYTLVDKTLPPPSGC